MNTSPIHLRLGAPVLLGTVLALAGCGDGDGSGHSLGASGTLSLQITDAAVDTAENVYVQFSGLELQADDGRRTTLYYCQDPADPALTVVSEDACTTLPAPKRFDLLALNSGNADFLLQDFTLPAGRYNWIRLDVDTDGEDDTCIILTVGGACEELTIPSGSETGLKLNRGFEVPAGGSADFTIDFDLRKSVHEDSNGYKLRPTLRLADNSMTGAIAGMVSNSLMTVTCDPVNDHPAVYVYEGGVTPDDIDTDINTPDPLTSATVKPDNGTYVYKAAFLEAGTYTIAFTCDAASDDPMLDDALTFSNIMAVSVVANSVTVQNIP
jgi:hypothetical protein